MQWFILILTSGGELWMCLSWHVMGLDSVVVLEQYLQWLLINGLGLKWTSWDWNILMLRISAPTVFVFHNTEYY